MNRLLEVAVSAAVTAIIATFIGAQTHAAFAQTVTQLQSVMKF